MARDPRKHTPACPTCGLKEVAPIRSAGNIARGVLNFATIMIAMTDVAPMKWRCARDGTEFSARGARVESD